jgi:DNA invertase Pin-like site-specific DNA recombinase
VTSRKVAPAQRTIALCYIRQSFTRNASDMDSPERQEENIRRACEKRGWTAEWYRDIDKHKSGRYEKNRPGWLALKARLGDSDVAAVVANDLSRLHRKGWRVGDLIDFVQEHQVDLVLAAPGREIDLSSPTGRILVQFIAMLDEWYAADISQRAKDLHAYRKIQGKTAARPPFGTKRKEDGYLEPDADGAWWMSDGSFQAGTPDAPPEESALWRSYYQTAKRTLEVYVENKHGLELVAYQLNIEGWPFKARDGEPRSLTKDDVRRIIRNWPEYGGLVLEKASKWRHVREFLTELPYFIEDRAVMPLALLTSVAQTHFERSREPRDRGVRTNSRIYVLNGMTYCAHCERLAIAQNNPKLRSRLQGRVGRYAHKEGVQCGCKNRSVLSADYEREFGRLIKLLTVSSEGSELLMEWAHHTPKAYSPTGQEVDIETEKREAITLCRRRIDAAVNLYGDGRISREEYLRRVEHNEREITYWEARTSEAEKASLELAMCINAVDKLSRLWDSSDPEDRQGMARSLFNYIVFDLDSRRIVDFRLKPWADRFLVLRAALYENENEAGTPFSDTISRLEHESRDMLPEGFNILQVASHGRLVVAMVRTLKRLSGLYFSKPFPHVEKRSERDTAIRNFFQQGVDLHQLAAMFSLSYSRVYQIAYSRKRTNKRSSAAE